MGEWGDKIFLSIYQILWPCGDVIWRELVPSEHAHIQFSYTHNLNCICSNMWYSIINQPMIILYISKVFLGRTWQKLSKSLSLALGMPQESRYSPPLSSLERKTDWTLYLPILGHDQLWRNKCAKTYVTYLKVAFKFFLIPCSFNLVVAHHNFFFLKSELLWLLGRDNGVIFLCLFHCLWFRVVT